MNLIRYKHSRTPHLPCSLSKTSDDKTLRDYSNFEGKQVVITEKLDGENFVGYSDGYCHARSIDSRHHLSRDWAKKHWATNYFNLRSGYRVIGENVYAAHSISYSDLKSYLYLFAVIDDKNTCLSWQDTVSIIWSLDCPTPEELYCGNFNLDVVKFLAKELLPPCEGFVIRNANAFNYDEFGHNCGKFVRANHVQTDEHWMNKEIIPNKLSISNE